jgi:hypothetical protein
VLAVHPSMTDYEMPDKIIKENLAAISKRELVLD